MTEGKIMTLMLGENNSLIHPLYLQMTIRKAKQLGINRDQFVGVLHNGKIDYLQKLNPSLFVMVKTLQISSNTLQNDSVLLATEEFFKHYNLSVGAQFLFEVVHPIPLDKVVFGAYTSEAFTWCKSEKWNQNIIKMLSSGNILCRNGDIPLFNIGECENPNLIYDLITVECSPVCQGLLTNETSVLVVKLAKSRTDNRNEKTNEVKRDKSVDSFLNLMNYTSRLLIMNQVPSNCLDITNKNVIKSLATSDTALKILRNAKLFNIEIMAKPISEPELCLEEIDLHNSVFISSFDISNSLEISEKMNWIYVKLKYLNNGTRRRISSLSNIKINSNVFDKEAKRVFSLGDIDDIDQDNYPWRLVQIYTLSSFFPNGTANITPQLWFNLNKHHSLLLQPECRLIIKQATPEDIPPFAEEVYLALVLSPNYSSLKSFDHLLKSYFKITRYLKVGDVIALYNKDTSSGDNIVSESFSIDTTLHPTIYFHVSRIVSQTVFKNNELGYRVDINNSRLYQSGTKENYVPVTMETFHCERPFHKIFDSPSPTGPIGKARDELCSIITPFLKSRQLREKVRSNILLSGPVGSGKKLAIQAVCRSLNLHLYSVDCQDLVGEAAGATEMRLRNSATKAMKFTPVIFHLNNVSLLSRERKETSAASGDDPRTIGSFGQVLATLSGPSSETTRPVIVIATTNSTVGLSKSGKGESLHPDLAGLFLYNICMRTPNEEERAAILENLLPMEIPHSISVSRLALKTVGFLLSDLNELLSISSWNAFKRVSKQLLKKNTNLEEIEIALSGVSLQQKDFDLALEKLLSSQAHSIGAPKIPNVQWDDVGGLGDVKKEILNTIQLPLNHPELIQSGLKRSGVLLHGPPGTGKTLLAKAVATECSLNFLSVKGPELINMYVGQSEENVREVFHRARSASPCVIFFDELDSLAPNRGLSGDSGGVMDRVVSQLLAELDGINQTTATIFVIGATNRPDLLDPALLRPGRFDRLVELSVAKTSDERLHILAALTRKMPLSSDVNIKEIESQCPPGLTGADFYSLCSDAQTKALERCIISLEKGEADEERLKPEIKMQDFTETLITLVPSVSN